MSGLQEKLQILKQNFTTLAYRRVSSSTSAKTAQLYAQNIAAFATVCQILVHLCTQSYLHRCYIDCI